MINIVSCANNERFLQINTIYYLKTVAKYRDMFNNNYSFWNALCIASMRLMFRDFHLSVYLPVFGPHTVVV